MASTKPQICPDFIANIVLSLNPTYTPLLSNKLNKQPIFKGTGSLTLQGLENFAIKLFDNIFNSF